MRALTAVLLQIREAHLATQHGDPFRERAGSNESAYFSKILTLFISQVLTLKQGKKLICQSKNLTILSVQNMNE